MSSDGFNFVLNLGKQKSSAQEINTFQEPLVLMEVYVLLAEPSVLLCLSPRAEQTRGSH